MRKWWSCKAESKYDPSAILWAQIAAKRQNEHPSHKAITC